MITPFECLYLIGYAGCLIGLALWALWLYNVALRPKTNDELGLDMLRAFYDAGDYNATRTLELHEKYGWEIPLKSRIKVDAYIKRQQEERDAENQARNAG